MNKRRFSFLVLMGLIFSTIVVHGYAQEIANSTDKKSTTKVILANQVDWQKLNPARGDQSPQAATLWGDRNGKQATGFLAKFVDGFSSPPHIHNVSYRAVVIAGRIHNDDPDAKPMWMPPGSYWTQPAGEVHITSSRGAGIALVEIESGPYLVLPKEKAKDNGERPVNLVPSNQVWLDSTNTSWITSTSGNKSKSVKISFLWGVHKQGHLNGTFVDLPAGFRGKIRSLGDSFQAVVIKGNTNLTLTKDAKATTLTPGSYVVSQGTVDHQFTCTAKSNCLIYVKNKGTFKVIAE